MTTQEPLSGHQIQALQKQMLVEFQRALDDVELRKIALQHACAARDVSDPVSLAREMHACLSEGAAAVLAK
jgi:hypothetical protein